MTAVALGVAPLLLVSNPAYAHETITTLQPTVQLTVDEQGRKVARVRGTVQCAISESAFIQVYLVQRQTAHGLAEGRTELPLPCTGEPQSWIADVGEANGWYYANTDRLHAGPAEVHVSTGTTVISYCTGARFCTVHGSRDGHETTELSAEVTIVR